MRFQTLLLSIVALSCGSVPMSGSDGGGSGSAGADAGTSTGGGSSNDAGTASSGGGATADAGTASAGGDDAGGSASGGGGSGSGGSGSGGSGSGGSGSGGSSGGGASDAGTAPVRHTLTIELNAPGGASGRVDSAPAGIACGSTCSADFDDGTEIVLTATPADGSLFTSWQGACSGSTVTCTLRLTADTGATAVFGLAPPPDECAGLGPLAPGNPSATGQIGADSLHDCMLGTSDGAGVVAVIGYAHASYPTDTTVHLFDPGGAELGHYDGAQSDVIEQLSGFIAMTTTAEPGWAAFGRTHLVALDTHGNVVASAGGADESFQHVTADPRGGVVADSAPKNAAATDPHFIVSFDEHLRERWRVQLPTADQVFSIGVDRQSNTLVIDDGERFGYPSRGGVWIDPTGHAGPQIALSRDGGNVLYPRVGNGFFLQGQRDVWLEQIDPFSSATPAPLWLATRQRGTTLHMARNGRAYAVISSFVYVEGVPSCSTTIDVVAPSGKVCGSANFPVPAVHDSAAAGGRRCSSYIVVGYDGTAIQQPAWDPGTGDSGAFTCHWQWWTGLLR